jgi:hypothetical protein
LAYPDPTTESIGIDDGFPSRNPGGVTDPRAQAERFAELFRAVYLTFHRRDEPRSQLAGASRAVLEREDDPADRRRTLIWLTPSGHEALRRDREVLGVDHLVRAMARLPPGQADDLIAGLRALVDLAPIPKED